MPRHVDPQQRRRDVAHAVWRVVLRAGLAKATVRAVAKEAGLSVGALRHYFQQQHELQIYASELIAERARQRLAALDKSVPVRQRIEHIMWALLPVTEAQAEEERVRLAFQVESRTNPQLAAVIRDKRSEELSLARQAIVGLRDAGLTDPAIDVEASTVELLALLDGLSQAAALHPDAVKPDTIKQTVRRWLDGIAPASATRSH